MALKLTPGQPAEPPVIEGPSIPYGTPAPESGVPSPTLDDLQAAAAAPQPDPMAQAAAAARQLADQIERGMRPPPHGETFTVHLPQRFAGYVRERAAVHGDTVERHLEGIVRRFWQVDPWRLTDTRPRMPGEPAGSGRR